MKGKTLSALGIIFAILGVALLIFHQGISSKGVVITGGIIFIVAGIANLVFFDQTGKSVNGASRALSHVANAAAIILGICLLVFQSTFIPLVPFIFGLIIAISAVWQFFLLALGTRPYQLPGWLYLFPLLITGGAIYVFLQTQSEETDSKIMLFTGACAVLLGIACIAEGWALGLERRRSVRESKEKAASVTETASAVESDSLSKQKSQPETTENLDDPAKLEEK